MLYSDVREAQLSAAGALANLCVNASNKKTVAAAGGVEALVMLLSDKVTLRPHTLGAYLRPHTLVA
jgi:hypothetical protein